MNDEESKALAARKSLDYIENGMAVGLGTGTTAKYVIELVGERVRQGLKIRAVPTSRASGELAKSYGIPLTDFDHVDHLDVTIDGADEIGPNLALIKGGGGALLHEKIVATASSRVVIIAGMHKTVATLGKFPLPVEVIPFAAPLVQQRLAKLGVTPVLRKASDGSPYVTDEGNYILDCPFGKIPDPAGLADSIRNIVGVVEHGLFVGIASLAVVADDNDIKILTR